MISDCRLAIANCLFDAAQAVLSLHEKMLEGAVRQCESIGNRQLEIGNA